MSGHACSGVTSVVLNTGISRLSTDYLQIAWPLSLSLTDKAMERRSDAIELSIFHPGDPPWNATRLQSFGSNPRTICSASHSFLSSSQSLIDSFSPSQSIQVVNRVNKISCNHPISHETSVPDFWALPWMSKSTDITLSPPEIWKSMPQGIMHHRQ